MGWIEVQGYEVLRTKLRAREIGQQFRSLTALECTSVWFPRPTQAAQLPVTPFSVDPAHPSGLHGTTYMLFTYRKAGMFTCTTI